MEYTSATTGVMYESPQTSVSPSRIASRERSAKRVKVSRACDRCKKRKIKCTGRQPCTECTRLSSSCEYTAEYHRGRLPSIEPETRSPGKQSNSLQIDAPVVTPFNSGRNGTPLLTLDSGRSNPPAIYQRTQETLKTLDSPLPKDLSVFVLPPEPLARTMLSVYFDFAIPANRILHRPTAESWMNEFFTNYDAAKEVNVHSPKNAVIFMIFALAQGFKGIGNDSGNGDSECSFLFFQAAENQLKDEILTGENGLITVQVKLMQCYFLLSRGRIHHCWRIFGNTVNLIIALSFHRKRKCEANQEVNLVNMEGVKRAFWTAYTLDKYMSGMLGRPQALNDEDIDQEFPSLVLDNNLTSTSLLTTSVKFESAMEATLLNFKLATTIARIGKGLYSIRPLKAEKRLQVADELREDLNKWRQGALHFLDAESSLHPDLLTPSIRRQSIALRSIYLQTVIILHRPFLLESFKGNDSEKEDAELRDQRAKTEGLAQECVNAAFGITEIIDKLYEQEPLFSGFWFVHYVGYCAAVVFYIDVIRKQGSPSTNWSRSYKAGDRLQNQISRCAEKQSFSYRCSEVLQELHREVVDHIRRAIEPSDPEYSKFMKESEVTSSEPSDPPGWHRLYGIGDHNSNSVIDRIDRWGFANLAVQP